MKVVILAGGMGTRLSEETKNIPKPMVPIGEKPILWHIMKIYSHYGFNEFIICLGYKGDLIKQYFKNYFINNSDFTLNLENNSITIHEPHCEPWKITFIDTGLSTKTGGRIKKIEKYLNNETFMLTYGDGLADINIKDLVKFHKSHGKLATVTGIIPEGRFGILKLDGDKVLEFAEKKDNENSRINGGFFVLEPEVIKYIKEDEMWETNPLENLARDGELLTYFHDGFWMAMDKLSDKMKLEELWSSDDTYWKVWK